MNPGPGDHNTQRNFGEGGSKYTMGLKTTMAQKFGIDQPGPGDYEMSPVRKGGPTHLIGTGKRSDLGVGKSFLSPGPGQYNLRGKLDGPQVGFGSARRSDKLEKSYDPGPGSYMLPGTVGNIPKYLLSKKNAAKKVKSKTSISFTNY